MSNDQRNSQDDTLYTSAHDLAEGKINPNRSREYRPPVAVADIEAQIEAVNPEAKVPGSPKTPAAKVVDPEGVYGFQDIRKGTQTPTSIEREPGFGVLYKDLINDIRAKNYPEGEGKAPPVNGEGKAEVTLDDKGVLAVNAQGNVRDQDLYKIDQRYKIDATFQTEALAQNDSELNKLRPGFRLPFDVREIGNNGTLSTLDAKFEQRIGMDTLGHVTAKINAAEKTTVLGVGAENEVSGSKANLEAGFKQVGDITQLTQLKFSGEHHRLQGGMVGATLDLNFLPETGKFNGYDFSATARPDGSLTTYSIGFSENKAENLNKFNIGAKSQGGTSLEYSKNSQTTGDETESKKVDNEKLSFETKIYGRLEPIKKGEDEHDPRNLREDGTLSLSAERTTTTTKKPDPESDAGAKKTEVSQEVKLAGSYKSTAGTEISGGAKIKDGTLEEADASLKTPVFTTKHPKPGEKDEGGELKKPTLEKQGDISVSGQYRNTATEKTLEVAAGYQSVDKATEISGKVKTNTETGQVISASGKLVSEVQDLKAEPDKDGKHKKIGTMTLEGSYDAPKQEATGKFDVAMDDKTGFKVGATLGTDTGKLKKIEGETSFFVESGTKILLGGNANFVDKTVGGKLEITAPKGEGSLKLDATFKNIEGTYQLQKFTGSVQGKDKDGNITKIEGAIDNDAKTASAKIGYTDAGTKHTYGAYANFKDQKISEAGLSFEGKVGDPKMAQNDLKASLAATFNEGRLDGGKVSIGLTPSDVPTDPKYKTSDTYFIGANGAPRKLDYTLDAAGFAAQQQDRDDPAGAAKRAEQKQEAKQALVDARIAALPEKDQALFKQSLESVREYNASPNRRGDALPELETASSVFQLAKKEKLNDVDKVYLGNPTSGGPNLFVESSTGQRAHGNALSMINTNEHVSLNAVEKMNKDAAAKTENAPAPEQSEVQKKPALQQ